MRTLAGLPSGTLVERLPRRIRSRVPPIHGRPIRLRFLGGLRASRDRIAGIAESAARDWPEVHAGTFIRRRVTIADSQLRRNPSELARILIHELFHYAWVRLGNPARRSFEALLRAEMQQRARGELGWSAEMRKVRLSVTGGRMWREYVCEAFCDTAAWLYSGIARHDEFTLASRHRRRRARWFNDAFGQRGVRV